MAPCKFFINIKFVLLLTLINCFGVATKGTAGPYKANIADVRVCEKPSRPFLVNSPIIVKMQVTNTTNKMLLGGNVTITGETPNAKYRLKSFIWENGKWAPNFIMNDIGCHGMLLHVICGAVGMKYDRKKCTFMKGEYYFKDFDVNALQHIWASKMEYGKMMWRSEIFTSSGTLFCLEFFTVTEPA